MADQDIGARLRALVREHLDPDGRRRPLSHRIEAATRLREDLGADSLDQVELQLEAEVRFGLGDGALDVFGEFATVGEFEQAVIRALPVAVKGAA